MRWASVRLVSLLLLISLVPGCVSQSKEIKASPGEDFVLSIGQEARITGDDLKISFDEVIGDSRCPRDVICIWEGRASMVISVTRDATTYRIVLNEPGLTDSAEDEFLNYRVAFHLEPYPEQSKELSESDYRLHLNVYQD